jgi:hypothetical protein
MEIAGQDVAKQLEKAKRKIAREWCVITTTLQKQLGVEQMRVVELQKLGTRSARVYELGLGEVEKKLGQAHEARQVAQDEYKVGTFFTLLDDSFIYDLFPFRLLNFVHKVALAKIDKLSKPKRKQIIN